MTKEKAEITVSDAIWNRIKGLQLDLFALPDQIIEKNVHRVNITDDKLYLTLKAPAVLPAIEAALSKLKMPENQVFEITQAKNYTIISITSEI
jgi:hypothetical protein